MECSFQLPLEKPRRFLLDYPEVQILSSILVATKLCFPLSRNRPLLQVGSDQSMQFSWPKWQKGVNKLVDASQASGKEPDFSSVTVDQVTSMTTEELDKYLAHVASLVDRKSG